MTSLSAGLQDLIEEKAGINPLWIQELILSLMQTPGQLVYSHPTVASAGANDGNGYDKDRDGELEPFAADEMRCSLMESFDFETDVAEPPSVCKMLGTRVDRLNNCQKMILKVPAFSYALAGTLALNCCFSLDGKPHTGHGKPDRSTVFPVLTT